MSAIACLPEELLLHILSFLDAPPPSASSSREVPTAESLFRPSPLETPLKQCSLISMLWRRLCAPLLFKHLKVALQTILPPVHYCPHVGRCTHAAKTALASITRTATSRSPQEAELDALTAFAEACDLPRLPPTLMVHQWLPCSNIAPLGHSALSRLWQTLLSALSPRTLTIIAAPKNLGELCNRDVDLSDSWAFKIALQRIDMSLSSHRSLLSPTRAAATSHNASPQHAPHPTSSPFPSKQTHRPSNPSRTDPSPLTLHPWTHLTYHGGSCLPVFGEYHYFEKRPPCLLSCTSLQPYGGFVYPTNRDTKLYLDPHSPSLGHNLRKLTYNAVFPHLIHIQSLVKAIMGPTISTTTTLNPEGFTESYSDSYSAAAQPQTANAGIPHLEILELRLTPGPGSRELDDLDLIGRGNLNLRDCWAEVERSYAVLVGMCRRAGVVCRARKTERIRHGEGYGRAWRSQIRGQVVDWNPSRRALVGLGSDEGDGLTSPTQPANSHGSSAQNGVDHSVRMLPRFRTFVSRDVEQGLLKDELEGMFTAFAPGWVKDGEGDGAWVRRGDNGDDADGMDVHGPMPWETT